MLRKIIVVVCVVGVGLLSEAGAQRWKRKHPLFHSSDSSEESSESRPHKHVKEIDGDEYEELHYSSDEDSGEFPAHQAKFYDDKLHSEEEYYPYTKETAFDQEREQGTMKQIIKLFHEEPEDIEEGEEDESEKDRKGEISMFNTFKHYDMKYQHNKPSNPSKSTLTKYDKLKIIFNEDPRDYNNKDAKSSRPKYKDMYLKKEANKHKIRFDDGVHVKKLNSAPPPLNKPAPKQQDFRTGKIPSQPYKYEEPKDSFALPSKFSSVRKYPNLDELKYPPVRESIFPQNRIQKNSLKPESNMQNALKLSSNMKFPPENSSTIKKFANKFQPNAKPKHQHEDRYYFKGSQPTAKPVYEVEEDAHQIKPVVEEPEPQSTKTNSEYKSIISHLGGKPKFDYERHIRGASTDILPGMKISSFRLSYEKPGITKPTKIYAIIEAPVPKNAELSTTKRPNDEANKNCNQFDNDPQGKKKNCSQPKRHANPTKISDHIVPIKTIKTQTLATDNPKYLLFYDEEELSSRPPPLHPFKVPQKGVVYKKNPYLEFGI